MAYVVQLKDFEGPLDLLLHLIGRAKVRIEDIFVSEITEQYLASVQDLSGLDMDAASEFLQMAATLMEIKSRALLPKPPKDEEEDPKEELLRRLEERGFARVGLAYAKGNPQSHAFWTKNRFQTIGEARYIVMEREI